MATPKKTGTTPKRTQAPAKQTRTASKAPATKQVAPTSMATRVKPVKTIPSGPIVRSKTLANGEPRPKSRRGK